MREKKWKSDGAIKWERQIGEIYIEIHMTSAKNYLGNIKESCEVTDIIIYYDGEVVDGRWYVDDVKKFIF